jgi:hypothetical protein
MPDINAVEVAKAQRRLLVVILFYILFNIAYIAVAMGGDRQNPSPLVLLFQLLALPLVVAALVTLGLLMSAMRRPVVSIVLACIAQVIPLVGLIVLLVVNQRATKLLQSAGYTVGLMGAKGV